MPESVETVAVAMGHLCAASRAGHIQCWGRNEDGQLGTGSYANSERPQFVVGF
jgi:alpha-tubulin suppressor-like RCC1 family protein